MQPQCVWGKRSLISAGSWSELEVRGRLTRHVQGRRQWSGTSASSSEQQILIPWKLSLRALGQGADVAWCWTTRVLGIDLRH